MNQATRYSHTNGSTPEKTQIVVSRIGNIPVEQLCDAFEEKNSDIQIVYLDITGGNGDYAPLLDWAENGALPDVIISAGSFFDAAATVKYLKNLSDDPIIHNYEAAALQRTAVDANIYWLPGPSDFSAMMYTKRFSINMAGRFLRRLTSLWPFATGYARIQTAR